MWEPATDIEQRMRDALRSGHQEDYFQTLARLDLLLPISGEGTAPGGSESWATWSAEDRTHVLAFTSVEAMRACLHSHAGDYRTMRFTSLADSWPDSEWWLAVDPGLPIEGYLPAWFVAQVATGDATLPQDSAASPPPRSPEAAPKPPPRNPEPVATAASGLPVREPTWAAAEEAEAPPRYGEPAQFGDPAPRYDEPPPARFGDPDSRYDQPPSQFATGAASQFGDPAPRYEDSYGWGDTPEDSYGGNGSQYSDPAPAYEPAAVPQQREPAARGFETYRPGPATPPAPQATAAPAPPAQVEPWPAEDDVEDLLARAASGGDTAGFLETLVRSWAYLPIPSDGSQDALPGDPGFRWHTDLIEGEYTVTAFTTQTRLAARYGNMKFVKTTFARLAQQWPGVEYSLYVNPGTEVGANMPGPQITTFVNWARTKGFLAAAAEVEAQAAAGPAPAESAVVPEMMQKVIPHHQVSMILERGYDRVAGFVYRHADVAELTTPDRLYHGLGLVRDTGGFSPTDESVHVVRWIGHRIELYQIAYGGNDPATAQRNGGWVVEPPPFTGDGFAPSVDGHRIAEYKVDSVRLPHGARIYRLSANGHSVEVASYDADRREWIRTEADASNWGGAGPYDQEQQHA